MKRWKTKNDKILVGGLLLLLAVISLPWVDRNELYNGFSMLSSSEEFNETHQAFEESLKKGVGSITADVKAKPEHNAKKSNDDNKSISEKETPKIEVAAKTAEKTISDSKVAEDKSKVEADCDAACRAARTASGAQAQESVFAALAKKIETLAASVTNSKNRDSSVDPRKRRDRGDRGDRDDLEDEDDLVEKACNGKGYKKDDKNYYTLCAMKELARLAKLKDKDKRPSNKEMTELLEEHVYDQLLEVMKEGMSAEASRDEKTAMQKADREIERLIEKLAGSRYKDTRKKLSEIKRLAINERVKETNKLLIEANALATVDPVTASMLLSEFGIRRNKDTEFIRLDLMDMDGVYSSMIGDGFSRSSANLEYRSFYSQPYNSISTKLWSSNPAGNYGVQGNRSARAGGYDTGFPRAPGIRGGTQQPGFSNQNGGINNGPPVAGQRAQFGPGGSINPAVNFQQQQQRPIGLAANNGANWPNTVQGQQPGRFNAPYNSGFANNWTNNVSPWTQQAGINGGGWNAPRVGSPGIANPGINGFVGGGAYGGNYYSGYSNYLYGNTGVARPPYAPAWGAPGAMQQGVYSAAPARF